MFQLASQPNIGQYVLRWWKNDFPAPLHPHLPGSPWHAAIRKTLSVSLLLFLSLSLINSYPTQWFIIYDFSLLFCSSNRPSFGQRQQLQADSPVWVTYLDYRFEHFLTSRHSKALQAQVSRPGRHTGVGHICEEALHSSGDG